MEETRGRSLIRCRLSFVECLVHNSNVYPSEDWNKYKYHYSIDNGQSDAADTTLRNI